MNATEQTALSEAVATALADVADALERAKIPYVVIGGIASALYGRPRASDDLDLLVAKTDAERVQAMIDASAANGRAVVGADATLYALTAGQVEELIIAARPDVLRLPKSLSPDSNGFTVDSTAPQADAKQLEVAGDLVARARQNAARIRFIEDSALLGTVGGVGAILRFRT